MNSVALARRVVGLAVLFWWLGAAAQLSSHAVPLSPAPASRLARIQASGELRACIWPEYQGITYRNPKSLQLSGIDIDNATELARELGVRPVFVDSSFVRLTDDLAADRCDIAMFAIGVTPQRQQRLNFSQPYLASDVYAITTHSNRRIRSWADIDVPGSVVAVARGTLHEPLMRARLQHAALLVLDSGVAREQEVRAGRADVFMTDYPYSRRLLDTADWARLVSSPTPFHLTPYAWAMMPGDPAFLARVDQVLAGMKRDGRLVTFAKRHGLEAIAVR